MRARGAQQPAGHVARRRRMISLHEPTSTWPNSRGRRQQMGVLFPRCGDEWWISIHPGVLAPGREPGGSPCAAKRQPLHLLVLNRREGGGWWAGAAECSPREEGHVRNGVKAHRPEAPQRARRIPERGDSRAGERGGPRPAAADGSRWRKDPPARACGRVLRDPCWGPSLSSSSTGEEEVAPARGPSVDAQGWTLGARDR